VITLGIENRGEGVGTKASRRERLVVGGTRPGKGTSYGSVVSLSKNGPEGNEKGGGGTLGRGKVREPQKALEQKEICW